MTFNYVPSDLGKAVVNLIATVVIAITGMRIRAVVLGLFFLFLISSISVHAENETSDTYSCYTGTDHGDELDIISQIQDVLVCKIIKLQDTQNIERGFIAIIFLCFCVVMVFFIAIIMVAFLIASR